MKASKVALIPMLVVCLTAVGEPVAVKPALSAALAPPAPTTIGELSELARQKRIAEEAKPVTPAAPPRMTIVPSTAILTSAVAAAGPQEAPAKKEKPAPPPEVIPGLLAIGRTAAGMRYVELADTSGANKYAIGQITPSGWMVTSIGSQHVEISKPEEKKKPARHMTLSLVTP